MCVVREFMPMVCVCVCVVSFLYLVKIWTIEYS